MADPALSLADKDVPESGAVGADGCSIVGIGELSGGDDEALTGGVEDVIGESASVEVAVVITVPVALSADPLASLKPEEIGGDGLTGRMSVMFCVAPPETNSFAFGLANECQLKIRSELSF